MSIFLSYPAVVKAAPVGADRIGDVIIDDYIRTSEPVVDYLTKYSGIAPGDLDPGVSPHNLGALLGAEGPEPQWGEFSIHWRRQTPMASSWWQSINFQI